MLKILRYLKPVEWFFCVISTIFIVFQVYLNLRLPEYMNKITEMINFPSKYEMHDIYVEGFKMLMCALLGAVCSFIISFFAAYVATGLAKTLRSRVFTQVSEFSASDMEEFSTDSLITRTTNDVMQIQMILAMGLVILIQAPIQAVWAICKIGNQSFEWTMLTVAAVALLLFVISILMVFAMPRYRKVQKLIDKLNLVTRENLSGLKVIRAYNAESYERKKFEQANDDITNTNIFVGKFMPLMPATMTLIMNGLSLGIYWIGAYLIKDITVDKTQGMQAMIQSLQDRGAIFANMVVFVSYAVQVVMSFVMLAVIFVNMPRAQVAAKRVLEVINKRPSITDGAGSKPTEQGTVQFDNVSFKYPDAKEAVIENISFEAKQGQTVAFIGKTGSGKSTLVSLIPRFYELTAGQIYVDGVAIDQYKQEDLRNIVGFIPQKAFLFKGTVKSNLTYGTTNHSITNDDIKEALDLAQATPFVDKMEGGIDAPIAQGGSNVSGGQRQRLAMARTLARKPEILIFDDSFSALDYKTDQIIRADLKAKLPNVTKLIVAQRIGTIKDADQIIVLEDGQIVGRGRHDELMQTCEVYQEIAYSQLSKEELADAKAKTEAK